MEGQVRDQQQSQMERQGPGPRGWGDLYLSTASFLCVSLMCVSGFMQSLTWLTRFQLHLSGSSLLVAPLTIFQLLCATPWTVAHQAPLSMGFSRQEYWSGLPFPPPGDLPDPRLKPTSNASPALTGSLYLCATWEALTAA